jgi:hypothetical protein
VTCTSFFKLGWLITFVSSLLILLLDNHVSVLWEPRHGLIACACWLALAIVSFRKPYNGSLYLGFSYFHAMIVALATFKATALVSLIVFIHALIWPWIFVCCSSTARPGAFAFLGSVAAVTAAAWLVPIVELHEI